MELICHHPVYRPQEIWLIRRCDHQNPVFRDWLHHLPNGGGEIKQTPGALLPVTVLELPPASDERVLPTPGVIVLTVGVAQLRLEGSVDGATLAQVLARLVP
jgi:transposase